jgi:hypothetical protein
MDSDRAAVTIQVAVGGSRPSFPPRRLSVSPTTSDRRSRSSPGTDLRNRGRRTLAGRPRDPPALDKPRVVAQLGAAYLLRAESAHGARERSTPISAPPGASQMPGCCKHQSSSRAASGCAAGCGHFGSRPVRVAASTIARCPSTPKAVMDLAVAALTRHQQCSRRAWPRSLIRVLF